MSYNETTKFCTVEDVLADDWYEILECNPKSSQNDIEENYRRLAKMYHPDRNKDPKAIQMFYRINGAYQILSDREIRAYYDYESGNKDRNENYRFQANADIEEFKDYINDLTGGAIEADTYGDNLWDQIASKYVKDKSAFNRQLNVVGTLDILKKDLTDGTRAVFPLYRYKTCAVCRGVGKIGIDDRETCYNCEGYGMEDERIFVYVEIPKKYDCKKLLKVSGRGHKIPMGTGDLILKINPVNKLNMVSKMYHRFLKNRGMKDE